MCCGSGDRLVEQLLRRNDPGDEAHPLRLVGVDHPAGEDHVHRLRLADEPRQPLRRAGARQDADRDLRLTETGRLGGEDEVAHQRQLAAAAERVAGDGSDDRLAAPRDPLPRRGDEVREIDVDERTALHLLDVGAGSECLLVAGQHDRADGVVRPRARSRAAVNWLVSASHSALNTRGRFKVIRPTLPRTSTRTRVSAPVGNRFDCLHLDFPLHRNACAGRAHRTRAASNRS